ncbi:MAG: trigger factor [Leptolyngbyaceae cyanobacterium]
MGSDSKAEHPLQRYRLNLATLVPIDERAAQMGDVAVVDFTGEIEEPDGSLEPFEGGSAEDFQVELKEGGFIDGFVEGIVGMSPDETRELSLKFPEDYPQEDLADKAARFTVTVKELKEKELPELDDDFAEEVSEFETLEALRTSLEERYQKEAQDETESNQFEALLNELLIHLDAEIPETLIRREATHLVQQAVVQLSRQGLDVNKLITPEIVENMRERSRPEAIDRLRRTLALGEVAKQESITIEDEEIQARMTEMLNEVSDPDEIDHDRLKEVVNEELLQEKILKWLLENNTVELVPEGTLTPDDPAEADEDETEALAAAETDPAAATVEVAAATVSDEPAADVSADDDVSAADDAESAAVGSTEEE